jgi:nucleoside-diphosphate-sugar epimerase
VKGKLPFFMRGVATEVVDIDDVAEAMILASERGRNGERCIISESYMTQREMLEIAADATGVRPARIGIPMAVLRVGAAAVSVVTSPFHRDLPLSRTSIRLMEPTSPADHSKATRELGWRPEPTETSIRRAARFYVERSRDKSSATTP